MSVQLRAEVHLISTHTPHIVAKLRAQMSNFLFEVSDLVKTECGNAILLEDMNISTLMTHAQYVEGYNLRDMDKDNTKSRIGNF